MRPVGHGVSRSRCLQNLDPTQSSSRSKIWTKARPFSSSRCAAHGNPAMVSPLTGVFSPQCRILGPIVGFE